MQVTITKNFIPLFIVIIMLIAILILYYVFRSPLIIKKESGNLIKKEGGISEISVILHIKNRGKSKIEGIEVTEAIPRLVSVEREVSIGSLQPTKILRHEKRGTVVVKWSVNSLDVSEERVLSYKIKSKLPILGSFSLPAAAAVFKFDGKTLTATSNRLIVE